jgi:hypothetical protein
MFGEDILYEGRWKSGGAAFGFVMVLRGFVFFVSCVSLFWL